LRAPEHEVPSAGSSSRRARRAHLVDEDVEDVAQPGRVVHAINDVALILVVDLGLGAELNAKELGRV
jgi:hypothetical protein